MKYCLWLFLFIPLVSLAELPTDDELSAELSRGACDQKLDCGNLCANSEDRHCIDTCQDNLKKLCSDEIRAD